MEILKINDIFLLQTGRNYFHYLISDFIYNIEQNLLSRKEREKKSPGSDSSQQLLTHLADMMLSNEISNSDFDIIAKVLILGNSNVGKTSILVRYVFGTFEFGSSNTEGVDNYTKIINFKDCNIKLSLWDTAGQEKYRQIVANYYRGTKAVILVFDMTENKSLLDIKFWLMEL